MIQFLDVFLVEQKNSWCVIQIVQPQKEMSITRNANILKKQNARFKKIYLKNNLYFTI